MIFTLSILFYMIFSILVLLIDQANGNGKVENQGGLLFGGLVLIVVAAILNYNLPTEKSFAQMCLENGGSVVGKVMEYDGGKRLVTDCEKK